MGTLYLYSLLRYVQGQSVQVLGGQDMVSILNKKDEQIDRLLSIIEKSSK